MIQRRTRTRPDGVQVDEGLVGEEGHGEHGAHPAGALLLPPPPGALGGQDGLRLGHDPGQEAQHGGQQEDPGEEQRPQPGHPGVEQPAGEEEGHRGGRDEAAPQVVEDLPAVEGGQGVGDAPGAPGRRGRRARPPGRGGGTSPPPASRPGSSGAGARSRPGTRRGTGRTARCPWPGPPARGPPPPGRGRGAGRPGSAPQDAVEGADVVDPLADVAPLAGQVLVDVRDGLGVGIGAHGIGEEAREAGRRGAGEGGGDAGLDDGVALGHGAPVGGQAGPVEGVRQRLHQAPGGAVGELGVGVQGDHEAHPVQGPGVADVLQGGGGQVGPLQLGGHLRIGLDLARDQQPVQLLQLAPLALPAHPHLLGDAPLALAVEEGEEPPSRACCRAPARRPG